MLGTEARLYGVYEGGDGEAVEAVICNPGWWQLQLLVVLPKALCVAGL